ncbi:MAG: aspartate/glutamate racemase family protein [Beijerinckiaceae bacterium]|nr:aspartate/glutamate racemase family protein [Beijerinckiaceae bacterium]
MRLLAINPNTTAEVTNRVVAVGRALAPPDVTILGATGRFGARYISSRSASAIAGHATLDAFAEHGEGVDGVLLACFGDPGLHALREIANCPVLGLAEASCLAAAEGGRRFSILTGGERWGPILQEFVSTLGLSASLASIRTVAPTGGEIAANPAAAYDLLTETAISAAREDGAEAVILGGAGLAGIAAQIRDRVPVPLLCSVETGFKRAFAMLENPPVKPVSGDFALPAPVETIGLSPALTARLERN